MAVAADPRRTSGLLKDFRAFVETVFDVGSFPNGTTFYALPDFSVRIEIPNLYYIKEDKSWYVFGLNSEKLLDGKAFDPFVEERKNRDLEAYHKEFGERMSYENLLYSNHSVMNMRNYKPGDELRNQTSREFYDFDAPKPLNPTFRRHKDIPFVVYNFDVNLEYYTGGDKSAVSSFSTVTVKKKKYTKLLERHFNGGIKIIDVTTVGGGIQTGKVTYKMVLNDIFLNKGPYTVSFRDAMEYKEASLGKYHAPLPNEADFTVDRTGTTDRGLCDSLETFGEMCQKYKSALKYMHIFTNGIAAEKYLVMDILKIKKKEREERMRLRKIENALGRKYNDDMVPKLIPQVQNKLVPVDTTLVSADTTEVVQEADIVPTVVSSDMDIDEVIQDFDVGQGSTQHVDQPVYTSAFTPVQTVNIGSADRPIMMASGSSGPGNGVGVPHNASWRRNANMQANQMNQPNQMNQMNQMNQANQANFPINYISMPANIPEELRPIFMNSRPPGLSPNDVITGLDRDIKALQREIDQVKMQLNDLKQSCDNNSDNHGYNHGGTCSGTYSGMQCDIYDVD